MEHLRAAKLHQPGVSRLAMTAAGCEVDLDFYAPAAAAPP
jgi:hypothetical protein